MIPRPYQSRVVSRAKAALKEHGNTLAVAPTGAGKTLMLSMLIGAMKPEKALILQHREELVQQNVNKFMQVNPAAKPNLYTSYRKSWNGDTIFGMVQTLSRKKNLKTIPELDLLIIDEAHHAVADTYRRIVDKVLEGNDQCKIAGFTATPARGDGKGLKSIFNNCCDQITLNELIRLGYLVRPKTYVCTLEGVAEQLEKIRKVGGEFDMEEVASIMGGQAHNEKVASEWKRIAGDRKTIVFCSTINHATGVLEEFQRQRIKAAIITGETPGAQRQAILKAFDKGDTQVLLNVAVLTEGYDSQPVSCIVLLRPCSFKSTMIQMIGRGLRTINPELYPGVVKTDCLVLDFGTSLVTHGSLETNVRIEDRQKKCPECNSKMPVGVNPCPICGFLWTGQEGERGEAEKERQVEDVVLVELDILKQSPFRWVDLFGSGKVMLATGFDSWVAAVSADNQKWYAVGMLKNERPRLLKTLLVGEKANCLTAADDFLRINEDSDAAKKNRRWLNDPATMKQLELLKRAGYQTGLHDISYTKYSATAFLTFSWNRALIERVLFQ